MAMFKYGLGSPDKYIIDCKAASGNALSIIGLARAISKQIGIDEYVKDEIIKDMYSSDYNNLITVFHKNFGAFVEIYNVPEGVEVDGD